MNKIKIISILLGLITSSTMVTSVYFYKKDLDEKKELMDTVKQLETQISEESKQYELEEEVLGDTNEEIEPIAPETLKKEDNVIYVPPIDPDPITSCDKGKCGSKQMKESACDSAVCCEIKDDVYKLADTDNECELLKLENAKKPITLPHNGEVYYCDEKGHDAILQASQYKVDATKRMDECFDKWDECEEKSYNDYLECLDKCNPSHSSYQECLSICYEIRGYSMDICGTSADCINPSAIEASNLDELVDDYCD